MTKHTLVVPPITVGFYDRIEKGSIASFNDLPRHFLIFATLDGRLHSLYLDFTLQEGVTPEQFSREYALETVSQNVIAKIAEHLVNNNVFGNSVEQNGIDYTQRIVGTCGSRFSTYASQAYDESGRRLMPEEIKKEWISNAAGQVRHGLGLLSHPDPKGALPIPRPYTITINPSSEANRRAELMIVLNFDGNMNVTLAPKQETKSAGFTSWNDTNSWKLDIDLNGMPLVAAIATYQYSKENLLEWIGEERIKEIIINSAAAAVREYADQVHSIAESMGF